ncbi:hypothetical protein BBO99_00004967 [Phytophthora kernoviae]|uniref:Uncharacterized protein n=2 Tax=Phytophthora kernoviae TaxID=325452 RepID=A0A3R7KJJ7_9STRA|nr:hypothetical protein G195_006942 [Phytophthora kernoviae 00238/432]KAG2522144.1 hypothetical protein JM16_005961 [Phytophthora kernoviae]KAG2523787.1 hypothetical protein JM18_005645 [Phytophthora kernoviae]RLN37470.1 hypothetical protein BBI17_006212 [Phytophthora kernoviae]RLN79855.1 hypothetical protein BBO99_00004967 [Phytophthora kernoviae]
MFWSAALELKSQQQRPARSLNSSYGSFSRSSSSGSFHIPQSIPEHQPVSQFTSPIPDQRRVEEYFERPDTAFARTRASLQLSEHTQSALKLLLQGERSKKGTRATVQPQYSQDIYSMSKISGYSAHQAPMKQLEHTPLLLQARAHGQEEANPQENGNEHNYWMQELERRRAGLRQSRRRTCFVLFVMLFGGGSASDSMEAVNNLLGIGGDRSVRARHDAAEPRTGRMEKTFARPSEELEEESAVMTLDLDKHQTRLRGVQSDKTH